MMSHQLLYAGLVLTMFLTAGLVIAGLRIQEINEELEDAIKRISELENQNRK